MRILVTGATGFIGTKLAEALMNTEHELFLLDLKMYPRDIEMKLSKYPNKTAVSITCDLSSEDCGIVLPKDIDVIFHLASQQPNNPNLSFGAYLRGNLLTTRNLLYHYKDKGVKCLIYTSTINSGNNDYICTKRFAEDLCMFYANSFEYDSVILKLASVIGAGQKGGFVHDFYKQAKANEDVIVYGQGQPEKCIIHVDDVVQALLKCLKLVEAGNAFNQWTDFHISTKERWTIKAIAEYIIDMVKSKSQIVLSAKPTMWIYGDTEYAEEVLGFEPMGIMASLHKYIKQMEAIE